MQIYSVNLVLFIYCYSINFFFFFLHWNASKRHCITFFKQQIKCKYSFLLVLFIYWYLIIFWLACVYIFSLYFYVFIFSSTISFVIWYQFQSINQFPVVPECHVVTWHFWVRRLAQKLLCPELSTHVQMIENKIPRRSHTRWARVNWDEWAYLRIAFSRYYMTE